MSKSDSSKAFCQRFSASVTLLCSPSSFSCVTPSRSLHLTFAKGRPTRQEAKRLLCRMSGVTPCARSSGAAFHKTAPGLLGCDSFLALGGFPTHSLAQPLCSCGATMVNSSPCHHNGICVAVESLMVWRFACSVVHAARRGAFLKISTSYQTARATR